MKNALLLFGILCAWISGYICGTAYTTENIGMEKPQQAIQMVGKSYRVSVTEVKQ